MWFLSVTFVSFICTLLKEFLHFPPFTSSLAGCLLLPLHFVIAQEERVESKRKNVVNIIMDQAADVFYRVL